MSLIFGLIRTYNMDEQIIFDFINFLLLLFVILFIPLLRQILLRFMLDNTLLIRLLFFNFRLRHIKSICIINLVLALTVMSFNFLFLDLTSLLIDHQLITSCSMHYLQCFVEHALRMLHFVFDSL